MFQPQKLALILAFWTLVYPAQAQTETGGPRKLVVATRNVPPFAIKLEDGSWSGITIELVHAVVEELQEQSTEPLELELREMSLKEMLDAVERGEVQMAAAALTVNVEREARLDFSHPFHTSGLGIAVLAGNSSGWMNVVRRVFSLTFLKIAASLALLLLLSGVLVYVFEKRHNHEQFGGGLWRGLGAGVWWSIVTLTTVGYGDKAPKTVFGRAIAVLWMLSGILIISGFTASVTSALTVGQLRSAINGPNDLHRARVATVADSTSHAYLRARRFRHQAFPDLDDALQALVDGEADAVVYDAPLLRYQVLRNHPTVFVLPATFERQDYAIALSSGSPLREQVNRAVLRVITQRSWEETLEAYLGER